MHAHACVRALGRDATHERLSWISRARVAHPVPVLQLRRDRGACGESGVDQRSVGGRVGVAGEAEQEPPLIHVAAARTRARPSAHAGAGTQAARARAHARCEITPV
jgi:hypothetical protein